MSGPWLGIDVGGTTTRLGCMDADGALIHRDAATPPTLDAFLDTLERLRDEVGAPQKVAGTGVGLPGVVDAAGARWLPNAPQLAVADLADRIGERLGGAVVLGNDAQLALLGEARQGAAQGCASALFLSVGTGVGGALLLAGRVLRGAHGSAGAMGWMVVDPADPGDPQRGVLERRASGSALARAAAALDPPRTGPRLVDDARRGEQAARALLGRIARDLGTAIAGMASVTDPEVVVVGGGLGDALDLLAPEIRNALQRWGSPHARDVPVRAAALGVRAGLVGAAYAAREREEAWW